ncbi:hypothetical protein [Aquirufa nivalisilvae]
MKNKDLSKDSEDLEKVNTNTNKRSWISPDMSIWNITNIKLNISNGIDAGGRSLIS